MPYRLDDDRYDTPTRYQPEEWDTITDRFIVGDNNKVEKSKENQYTGREYPLECYLRDCLDLYSESTYPPPQRVLCKRYMKGGTGCIVWLDDFVIYFQSTYDGSDYVSGIWISPIEVECLPRNPTMKMTY